MLRRTTTTAVLVAVLGLGLLAGVGAALPWPVSRQGGGEAEAPRRLADADRAGQLFALRFRMYAEGGWRPAQPLSLCEACIGAAVGQGLAQADTRRRCGAACGME